MSIVEVNTLVKQDKKMVFALLKNMERFPEFMRDVKKITLIQRLPHEYITSWEVEIDGLPLRWQEIDTLDEEHYRINFQMLKGDYQDYRGCWQLRSKGAYTRISLRAEFNWGIPVLERYVSRTLVKRAKLGFLGMLKAIKNKLEGKIE